MAIAIVGILLSIGYTQLRSPDARLFANDVKAIIHQARYEAIKRNRPVAIAWEDEAERFVIRINQSSPMVTAACNGDTVLATKSPNDYRQIELEVDVPTNCLVWLPSGQGRTRGGSPAIDSQITIADGRTTRIVEVSIGGKVSVR